MKNHRPLSIEPPPPPPPAVFGPMPSSSSSSSSLSLFPSESESDEPDELCRMSLAPPFGHRKLLSKQLSMRETRREAAWERRRRQILRMQRSRTGLDRSGFGSGSSKSLTDEDLDELKGSIELGFGFNEEDGQMLCSTLPALDFYFAVKRQLSDSKIRFSSPSPVSTPTGDSSSSLGDLSSIVGSPRSPHHSDSWKICSPGDTPQQVKTRLKHWAQAVACSVRQCS